MGFYSCLGFDAVTMKDSASGESVDVVIGASYPMYERMGTFVRAVDMLGRGTDANFGFISGAYLYSFVVDKKSMPATKDSFYFYAAGWKYGLPGSNGMIVVRGMVKLVNGKYELTLKNDVSDELFVADAASSEEDVFLCFYLIFRSTVMMFIPRLKSLIFI